MKNFKTKLFAAAMAAPLAMSGMSVFAAGDATEDQKSSTAPTIENEFTMPDGTTVPNVTFTYTVTQAPESTGDFTYPTIAAKTITYTANDDNPTALTKSEPLFTNSDFKSAGIYEFDVTQKVSPLQDLDGFEQILNENTDKAQYKVRVYVTNTENGLSCTYTVQNGDSKQSFGEEGPVLTYKNNYSKTKVDEENGAFTLGQTVTGDMGDKNRDFSYLVTLAAPENAGENPFAGFIGSEAVTSNVTDKNFTMKADESAKIKLTKAPVGSTITITAQNADDHTTTYKEGNADLTTGDSKTFTYKVTEDGLQLIVNQHKELGDTPITGNIINNMPFLGLIAVALGGFIAYIALKRRQNA